MNPPCIPATALSGDLVRDWTGPADGQRAERWLSGILVGQASDGRLLWTPARGIVVPERVRLDPRRPEVAHRIADVLRARGHEVGHLLPVALGGRQGDAQANAPIPASCSFHGNARHVEPLPACLRCGGSGRVPFESDDFPPGTNACCCTCSRCRSEKVTIPAADVSAVLLAASVAGVEAERGVVQGVLGAYVAKSGNPCGYSCRDGGKVTVWDAPGHQTDGWRIWVGRPSIIGPEASGPETGPEGRAAADAALLRLGYAYLDAAAPFGVVVPFNLENER